MHLFSLFYKSTDFKMKSEHLVIDSCAFLSHANIRDITEHVYTCPSVVSEVRDRKTRRLLSVLPYELKLKKPSVESVSKIIEISKTTGDYRRLSHTDIEVLALTFELARQHGDEEINENVTPTISEIQVGGNVKADLAIPGFYLPSNNGDIEEKLTDAVENLLLNKDEKHDLDQKEIDENCSNDDDEEDDEIGWITPSTLREMGAPDSEQKVKVACITKDFSMQNVLKKMNLHIVSVDGEMIKSARNYVLRCFGCYEITNNLSKVFCPKCGNKTLKRVPVQLFDDGTMKMFFSRNPKILNPKGLQYSIPRPKGGKHSNNELLVEDQQIPHNRLTKKAMTRTDVWGETYECGVSPFAERDVDSRAFRLGIRPANNRRGGKSSTRFIKRK